jgi:hypothetical protein
MAWQIFDNRYSQFYEGWPPWRTIGFYCVFIWRIFCSSPYSAIVNIDCDSENSVDILKKFHKNVKSELLKEKGREILDLWIERTWFPSFLLAMKLYRWFSIYNIVLFDD